MVIVFLSAAFLEFFKYLEGVIDKKLDLKLSEALNGMQSVNLQENNSLVQSLRIPVSLKQIVYRRSTKRSIFFLSLHDYIDSYSKTKI